MPGTFITLEGGEGAGKSTQARSLADWAQTQGHETLLTREPGGTPGAEAIRNLLLNQTQTPLDATTQLLLFMAARADHVATLIRPALGRNATVICDRFQDSTAVYQGLAGGLGAAYADALYRSAIGNLVPTLTLILDIPPELGLKRAEASGKTLAHDRFEGRPLAFHTAVREGFLARARSHPARYAVIDASQPADAVTAAIRNTLTTRLGWHHG